MPPIQSHHPSLLFAPPGLGTSLRHSVSWPVTFETSEYTRPISGSTTTRTNSFSITTLRCDLATVAFMSTSVRLSAGIPRNPGFRNRS